ncbi:MAG: tetratricopeptide repeat protein [Deltaproteobacteria bacterium]|nr:tetratricopeptide repeat protein [Deltaproteobacteria bacterium]
MTGLVDAPLARWERWFLLAALSLGAALRLAFLWEFRASPFFDFPVLDSLEYLMWAREIQGGQLLWDHVHIHSPLYPYVLSALLSVSGDSLAFVRVVQALGVGLGSCVVYWAIARRCAGPVAGAVAVAIGATLWPLVYQDSEILVESLVLLLNGGALLSLIHARGRSGWLLAAGLLLGLSAAARPNAAAFVPLAALWAAWGKDGGPARRRILRFALVGLGAALVIVPIVARNHAVSGAWVAQANTWLAFYEGNNPEADGTANMRGGRPWQRFATLAEREGITTVEGKDRYYRGRALDWWRDRPADALRLLGKKIYLVWCAYETRTSLNTYYFRDLSRVLSLPWPGFGLLTPLALLGVLASALRRRRETTLLVVYAFTYTLATAAFMAGGRYRIPIAAAAIPLAGVGVAWLVEAARGGRRGLAAAGIAGVLLLVTAFRFVPADVVIREYGDERYNLGTILMALGRTDEAEAALRKARIDRPVDGRIPNNLGVIMLKTGRVPESLPLFRDAVRLYPELAEAWSNLGTAAAATGLPDEARRAYETSLGLASENGMTHLAYGLFLYDQGNADAGRAHIAMAQGFGAPLTPKARAILAGPGAQR